jgi:hypothetical protein
MPPNPPPAPHGGGDGGSALSTQSDADTVMTDDGSPPKNTAHNAKPATIETNPQGTKLDILRAAISNLRSEIPGPEARDAINRFASVVEGLVLSHQLPPLHPITKSLAKQITEIHTAVTNPSYAPGGAPVGAGSAPPLNRSWAAVAAQRPAPPRDPLTELTIRPANTSGLIGKDKPSEILQQITNQSSVMKRAGPVAAKKMKSGDIRLQVKDRAYAVNNRVAIQGELDATFVRRHYPIEVLGVPVSLGIRAEKGANDGLLRTLSATNGKLIPDIQFTRASWIPSYRATSVSTTPRTRTSLILGVESQAHQAECVRKGVVINGEVYLARLYDYGLHLVRCFNCSRWGHIGPQCTAPAACGHCGQAHETKACPNPKQKGCVNCKARNHKAWEVRLCPVARDRKSRMQALRMDLLARGAYIQAQKTTPTGAEAGGDSPPPAQPIAGAKRARLATDTTRQAGPGRPRGVQVAAAQPGQTTILSSLSSRVWGTPGFSFRAGGGGEEEEAMSTAL